MKKLLLVLALSILPVFAYNVTVVAQIYAGSCPAGWEAVASLSRTTNAHIADPNYGSYSDKLCIQGDFINDGGYKARTSLTTMETAIIGLYQQSNSHAEGPETSAYDNIAYVSCPVNASLKATCGAEESCFLEFYKSAGDSHVAECGSGIGDKLCVKATEPDIYEYACTCSFPGADWGSTSFIGTLGQCCGDDSGEKESQVVLDGACSQVGGGVTVCCADNKCGKSDSGYTCEAVGTACGSYLCSESDWQLCEKTIGSHCAKVDLDNNGLYDKFCDNSTGVWNLTSEMSDYCQLSCEQLNGIWTGLDEQNPINDENCCSGVDTNEWCVSTSERVTRCNFGQPIDCGMYCDASATISDDGNTYTCTSASDRDCTSNSCSGVDCLCTKGDDTGCYIDSACSSGNCATYTIASGEDIYFTSKSNPWDSENSKSFAGICCPDNGCAFDSDDSGNIDTCVINATSGIDSDGDGDIDMCYEGVWKECPDYDCLTATGCSCMSNSTGKGTCDYTSETPGIYSNGTGICNIQNTTLSCALPCDSDGNPLTREYVGPQGFCMKGGGGCLDIYKGLSWFGNSSLSFVNTTIDCLCDSQAFCNVTVYDETDELTFTTSQIVSATGIPELIALNTPFDTGLNTVNITCGCGASANVAPTSCGENVANLNYETTSSFTVDDFRVGTTGQVNVVVNNIGSVDLSGFTIGVTVNSGGVSVTNTTIQKYLANGASTTVPVLLSIPITMFNDTKQTVSNETSVLLFTNVTDVLLMHEVPGSASTYQCGITADCTTACPSQAGNCWAFGGESNFTCSDGVCCPVSQHFEDGGCCPSGYRCCVSDGTCTTEEWCANATIYSDYGIEWSCNDLRLGGQTCAENRMCDAGNCEAAPLGGSTYCCQALSTLTEAGGECSTIQGGDVCSSTGCCTGDSECSSGYWCSLFTNRCLDCPDNDDSGYFNGYCSSSQCKGSDADCCESDADCSIASGIAGTSYYCNNETVTCETCTTTLDYYCPSFDECYQAGPDAGDPDCCSTDADCFSGNICTDNTCVPKNIGMFCNDDAECGDGLSCIESACVLDEFLIINPTQADMNVGEVRYATIIVRDPQLKSDTYVLSLSGSYLQFAKIESGSVMRISLGPNEVKKFTMVLYGGAALSGGQIKVFASSESTAGISSEKTLTLNINQVSSSGLVAAAPGITFTESLAILLIGGVLAWSVKKL